MAPTIHYYCPCQSGESVQTPPPPHMASSSASFHPLHSLFFCEECDAVRCNRCVSVEVSGYYCPNCLFEVPSASVRAEKNRCARNCFSCPICRSTLQVVASDPPDGGDGRPSVSLSNVGEPPFFLYCNHCRWDSAEVGVTFEKPTGLAAQLQKFEDSAPESLEFERLKEHFEPFLRTSSLSSLSHVPSTSSHHLPTSSATAAASAALARDVPGVGKYNPPARSRVGRDRTANKDEMPEYKSRMDISVLGQLGSEGDGSDVEAHRRMETAEEIASLEQRWGNSWTTSLRTSDLRPFRIPLHSKVSKRCPTCRHILIKPEQKAQSVRYKIKLVAANYLPAMTVALPHTQAVDATRRPQAKVPNVADDRNAGAMMAGKSYPFHLALTNPLYDPIQVRLSVQRMHVTAVADSTAPEKARRTPFAISLPTSSFPVAAFAEAWEYDDDDDMFGLEDDELGLEMGRTRDKDGKGKVKTVGVLEKRANVTVVGGEVVIGKEARGHVKFNMLVSYTYRSDDPLPSEDGVGTPSRTVAKTPEVKTFTFYTVVDLGPILPREEKVDPDI
ncbi:dynactin p62 family-domain-containing protein [Suillus subalutaceus]|uniref:dynactin p62 family-domain-containing protein n=1 Tax=Suillus subalutaceus TaxID=48586 RepID=UPI001B87154C|nr:dynactin p62 family-domain-containing protein [Suillus subalutaceus]KAG1843004.1 dynactin p62 family-domain-containing protein [Suillus subalutaceus]